MILFGPHLLFFSVDRGHCTLQHDEDENHQANHDGGPFRRHTEVGSQRIDGGANQCADDGAEHIAEAAGDDGTADDHGCDCIKFPADAHGVDGRADVGRVHDGSEGGQRGGGQIDDVLRALDRKTHQLGRGTGTARSRR